MTHAALAAVLLLHGGAYTGGSPTDVQDTARALQGRAHVVNLRYRLGDPERATADAVRATRALRRRHRCVAVLGVSAGGSIAAYLSARGMTDASAAAAPPAQLARWRDYVRSSGWGVLPWSTARVRAADPSAHLQRNATPLLVEHAADDAMVPLTNSAGFVRRHPRARLIRDRTGSHTIVGRRLPRLERWTLERLHSCTTHHRKDRHAAAHR